MLSNLSGISINNKYGRKIGFIKHILTKIHAFLGVHKAFQQVDWEKVQRLVFICQGNICRSAYAEAYARHLGLKATSAGLAASQKGNADSQAIKMATKRNIDLTFHKTTHIDNFKIMEGDLFLCMEPLQANFIRHLVGNNRCQQITLLGLWSKEKRPFIQDPYGLTYEYWQSCLDIIDSAIEEIQIHIMPVRKLFISNKNNS